ncbi:fibronectin type III domain-containing protein [Chitinophaga sp. Hz27]|uniref:fibronectin type III domain-containing protein n=1 Tax=Chitinophaga sp. Hz27 TaxID=3347169 RepID=UPI0035DF9D81
MQKILQLLFCVMLLSFGVANAQSVIDPNDPIVRYTGTIPAQPADGVIGKWISTDRHNDMPYGWRSDSLKAYIYKGLAFRVQFPKSYKKGVADGKKYPVFLFFHGKGEAGPIQDNEYQLYHGGYIFSNAVTAGTFDGYLIYPQSSSGFWTTWEFSRVKEILDYMAVNNKADLNRIIDNGLSSGGGATWDFMLDYPSYVASALPMSSAASGLAQPAVIDQYKFTPVWLFQGALDGGPTEWTATQQYNAVMAAGGNMRYTLYPNVAHDTWYHAWAEADFFPTMNRAHILTPWPLGGRSEFCNGDPINLTVGIARGFTNYQWSRNNVVIDTATGNQINVTSLGTYAVRVSRDNGATWSEWSPNPLVIKIKAPTVTPPITTVGLASNVIPAPDGKTTVSLRLPQGYVQYKWMDASGAVVSTDSVFTTSTSGAYTAMVTEQYGCSSNPTAPFNIINANGPGAPDGIRALTATPVSKTQLRLDWIQKDNPQYNETFFEVYRGTQSGGPYTLVAKVNADITTYTDNGLLPNTNYYYVIRPVNNSAAGPVSSEVKGVTIADTNPPSAPANLRLNGATSRTSIPVAWDASTDDVGIAAYDIYVNGVKAYTTDSATRNVVLYGLTPLQTYSIYVIARDLAGNSSVPSAQLSAVAKINGLRWDYYAMPSTISVLPDFGSISPDLSGFSANIDLSVAPSTVNYAMRWTGYIRIPVSGNYQFQATSDDGSKFFFNIGYNYSGTSTINNDGLHGSQGVASSTVNLTAGVYPFTLVFFQAGGGQVMTLQWKSSAAGFSSFTNIDPSYYTETVTPGGTAPAAPSAINAVASGYKSINLNWIDNSTNESGFEVYRATTQNGAFNIIGRTGAAITTFNDNTVSPATRYYYRVGAVNTYGTSGMANSYPIRAWWKLNGNAADSSYFANNGSATGVTWAADGVGSNKSASFAGNTNSYISIGGTSTNTFLRDTVNARTISMWIKASSVSNKQYIVDIGNSSNGLCIRLNGNKIEGAVAANSNRVSIATTQNIATGSWVHVALVFNKGTNNKLKVYVNGVLSSSSTSTSSTILPASENAFLGKNSSTSQSATAFSDNSSSSTQVPFTGLVDNMMIIDQALVDSEVTQLKNLTFPINTTITGPLPAAPQAPSQLAAVNAGKNIQLTWKDNANNEDKFELYRSVNDTTNFRFLTTLDTLANTGLQGTYLDTSVFSNSTYYYKLWAVNITGTSAWSNITNATTPNNPPKIDPIVSRTIRFDNVIQIPISATDPDGDALTFSFLNLPDFITLVNSPNGPYLNVATDSSKQGTYLNNVVMVTDTHGASDTARFDLIINNNYPPVLASIPAVTMNEGGTQQLTLHATDQDANDTYTWTGVNLPSFITLAGNGLNCTATVHPGFIDAGNYTIKVQITDNKGGTDFQTFNLIVNKVNPNGKIFLDVTQLGASPAPWNMTNVQQNNNLKNDKGEQTAIGINFVTPTFWLANAGPNTGNNSGVVPDAVMKDYMFFGMYGIPDTIPVIFSGLDTVKQYNIRFYSGSIWADVPGGNNGVTYYKAGNQLDSINQQNNTTKLANLTNLKANADGTTTAYAYRPAWSPIGYISAVELDYYFDDGKSPAAPKNLTGQVVNDTAVLNWVDVAYNELNYQIFRSEDSISFTLLATAPQDATSYNDISALGNHKYYYKVRAVNSLGGSLFSNITSISLPNKKPVLADIADVKMKSLATQAVNVSATDDPADQITLAVAGLPSFGTFTDNGNGTGVLNFAPTADNTGSYAITITANDNHDGSSSKSFRLFVSDRNTTQTYFNIAIDKPAPAPWNNIMGLPSNGNGIGIPGTATVVDENNVANGMTLQLQSGWDGWTDYMGMNTGQNVGIYPDTVLYKGWYLNTGTQNIVVGGLDNNLRYNFVFFNSQSFGYDATTNFTINGTTVTSNAAYNIAKTVQLNNIAPVNGQVTISITKPSNAIVSRLNAIVVEAYPQTVAVMSPGSVRAIAQNSKKVAVTWADRSANETGFQIWRKTGSGGTDVLQATTLPNVTAYTDSLVQPNTQYIYHIRAVKSGVFSDFSATATTTTYAVNVYVNLTDTSSAGAPWNNTNRRPALGTLISNLKDDNGNVTGMGITITQNFTGVYGLAGMNTGNNSGVYPDAVMTENFVLFAGAKAAMKITGLNQGLAYNLTVFNSAADNMRLETRFIANGKQVTWLNANQNTNATATIYNVMPDQNGEIKLEVETGPQATFGLMAALVIQGYSPTLLPSVPGSLQTIQQNVVAYSPDAITKSAAANASEVFSNVTAFPNPFGEQININMTMKRSSSVYMEIFDLNGHLMYKEMLSTVPEGASTLRVYTGNKITVPGYYLIRLTDDQRKSTVIRAIKQ